MKATLRVKWSFYCSIASLMGEACYFFKSILIGGLLSAAIGVQAATYYVSPMGNDANNGTSWALAKQTIQSGINMATRGDTILVADGTYILTSQISISPGITVRSVNGAQSTTINGGGVTRCAYLDANAVLDGFTVTNGYSDDGGGVYSYGGTVQNCTISGNWADCWYGGGVCAHGGMVQNCIISGNWGGQGGGVAIWGGTVQNCIVIGNSSYNGGGVDAWDSTIQNCMIIENFTTDVGGGVCAWGGTVQNCTISGNTAYHRDYRSYGGGVWAPSGTVQNCIINGNTAYYGGGVAVGRGMVRNCTISGNTAYRGGGVFDGGTMQNCTISGNLAFESGGGVWVEGGTIQNCIAYYNQNGDVYNNDGAISYSCIGMNIAGVGNITNEPQFVSLGTGYGANLVPGNYRLRPTSPCINAGINQSWMMNAFDLDGLPRIFDGVVDMGAYECPGTNSAIMRNPTILSNRCDYGSNATGQTIEVWNAGMGAMTYALSPNVNWLSLSPASGTSTGEIDLVNVNYGSAGLAPGTYTGIVTITSAEAINSPQVVTVYLWVDNENNPEPGTVQFSSSSYSVSEDAGTVTLTVTRTGGSSGPATVDYTTSDDTALAGSDYTEQYGTLSWSDGDTSSKTITVSITDDGIDENGETFTVTLSNAVGAGLGSPSSATVTIIDNEGLGEADLEVSELKFVPVNLWAGDHPAMISFDLVNDGPEDIVAPDAQLEITFYLSSNTIFGDEDDMAIGTKTEAITLPAGSQTMLRYPGRPHNTDVTIPEGLSGDYYVFVNVGYVSPSHWVDPDGAYAMRDGPINVRIHPSDGEEDTEYRNVVNDYDGDGLSDMMVYDEPSGEWAIRLSESGELVRFVFGGPGYETVSGDYDGDCKVDPAVHQRKGSPWYIMLSGMEYQTISFNFGGEGETKGVVGDYNEDSMTDPGLYEEGSGRWYVLLPNTEHGNYEMASVVFGGLGHTPVAGDYDGDGCMDPAVYGQETGNWYVMLSGQGYGVESVTFGGPGYEPVVGDYDGDGCADPMLYHEATGEWIGLMSGSGYAMKRFQYGGPGYVPVAGDYDGDGKSDIEVYNKEELSKLVYESP